MFSRIQLERKKKFMIKFVINFVSNQIISFNCIIFFSQSRAVVLLTSPTFYKGFPTKILFDFYFPFQLLDLSRIFNLSPIQYVFVFIYLSISSNFQTLFRLPLKKRGVYNYLGFVIHHFPGLVRNLNENGCSTC